MRARSLLLSSFILYRLSIVEVLDVNLNALATSTALVLSRDRLKLNEMLCYGVDFNCNQIECLIHDEPDGASSMIVIDFFSSFISLKPITI